MSLSAEVFGSNSWIHKFVNIAGLGIPGWADRKFGTGNEAIQNSLGDIARQTAEEGSPRVIVWGRVRPIGGTIIYAQKPQKKWVVSYQDVAGKGGGDETQEVWTERVYRTYAIGICEGPISKISRVWKNNKLVYDDRGNAWGTRNNAAFLAKKRIYLGGFDQAVCPELQAIFGSDIPAHRGTAYLVVINQDLTEYGGAIPQYQFEVERSEGVYLTSRPYAIEDIQAVSSAAPSLFAPPYVDPDHLDSLPAEIIAGDLRDPIIVYDDWPAEALDSAAPEVVSATIRTPLIVYDDWPAEALDAEAPELVSGTIRDALIEYENWPAEAIDSIAPEITEGTLT